MGQNGGEGWEGGERGQGMGGGESRGKGWEGWGKNRSKEWDGWGESWDKGWEGWGRAGARDECPLMVLRCLQGASESRGHRGKQHSEQAAGNKN